MTDAALPAGTSTGGLRPGEFPGTLSTGAWGDLMYRDAAGLEHPHVLPVRAFPVTSPEEWISLVDPSGKELLLIPQLTQLPPEPRALLEASLKQREFFPRVTGITRAETEGEFTTWDVETDRGPVEFRVKHEEDVRRLGPNRALLMDEHGTRYLIPDIGGLDAKSRRLLDLYL